MREGALVQLALLTVFRSAFAHLPPAPSLGSKSATKVAPYKLQLEEPELSPLVDPESSRSRWTPGEG